MKPVHERKFASDLGKQGTIDLGKGREIRVAFSSCIAKAHQPSQMVDVVEYICGLAGVCIGIS